MGEAEIKNYRVAVVGPGAMGCLLAGFLARSGQDVWLLDKRRERAEHIRDKGIQIEGISGEHKVRVQTTTEPKEIDISQLIIICVKSYDTSSAARNIQDLIGKNTIVLTLQNGVGNLEELARIIEPAKLAGGVTSQGATTLGPGHIRHAGKGETVIGPFEDRTEDLELRTKNLEEIAQVFNKAGFPTRVADNVEELIWSKLIINAGINALAALTRLNNGRLPEFAGTKRILRSAVEEAVAVARAKRIKLIFENPVEKVKQVCRATRGNVCSMLQDVLKKRRTEIDYINGAIAREGKKLGIPTPVNEVLTALVKTIEETYALRVEGI